MAVSLNARQIKIVACISMLFSHVGVIFWPGQLWWQIPGRLAMPLFAFMIANGARHSSNTWKYLSRLLIFAVLIQFPYTIFLNNSYFNICFTLGFGLAAIIAWQSQLPLPVRLASVLVACLLAKWLNAEYNIYGVLMVFSAHLFFEERKKNAISWVLLNLPYLLAMIIDGPYSIGSLQLYSILSVPFIFIYNGQRGGGSRWEFYAFYIGHLALLYFLRRFLWGF